MRLHYVLFLIFAFSIQVISQDAVLVKDYNEGTESAFDNWNYESIKIGENILIPIFNEEHGLELGLLSEGQISLLVDLAPGEASSTPRNFHYYNDLVYFSANDENGQHSMWQTDGTEAGTQVAYNPGANSSSLIRFIESKSGWLYFTYNYSEFHRTNGTNTEDLGEIKFIDMVSATENTLQYKDELANIDQDNGEVFITQYMPDGTKEVIMNMEATNSVDVDLFALVGEYFIFELYDFGNDDISGCYAWKDGLDMPQKLDLPGSISRVVNVTDGKMIGTIFRDGVYSFIDEGDRLSITQVFDGDPETYTQEEPIISMVHKGKALFVGHDNFPDNSMLITDVETMETSAAFNIESYTSEIVQHNNFGFMASGISNGYEPTIHYYDFKENTSGVVKEFDERSTQTNSVRIVGVQDSKLYFMSNLNPDIGRELFYIDVSDLTNLDVDVNDLSASALDIDFYHNGFTLNHNHFLTFDFSVYDIYGQKITSQKAVTNENCSYGPYHEGMVLLTITIEDKSYSYLRYR